MLVRIKAKPQPSKRFQRKHVDSMWQGDSFQFRISSVGKAYVTGFTDDRSRFRVASGAYLHKSAVEAIDALRLALAKKRVPREIYLDNGKQFISKESKAEARKHGIKLIFGKPYHPRGRGKIERYRSVLWQELITQKRSLRFHISKESFESLIIDTTTGERARRLDGRHPLKSTMMKDTYERGDTKESTGSDISIVRFSDINSCTLHLGTLLVSA